MGIRESESAGLAPPLEHVDASHVRVEERDLIYFGGCDYLRLSRDQRVRDALIQSLQREGLNVAASRKTTGNHPLYLAVENDLASFFDVESALLVPTGYMTNLIVAQGTIFTYLLIDEEAHPSLWDAAELAGARVLPFEHCSATALKKKCAALPKSSQIALLSDGIFAHDGSIAPLAEYRQALPRNAYLWVDDAHGAGVLGLNGRGSMERAEISRAHTIQTITLSKAFGLYGGAILGSKKLINGCIRKSRLFAGSTPLPLPLAAAARVAIEIVSAGRERGELLKRIEYFHRTFPTLGPKESVPIISVIPTSQAQKERLKKSLLAAGIFPSFIRYPSGPKGGYFRFALSSEHTFEQIKLLGRVLTESHLTLAKTHKN
jgi:7-keto-8-aminopelargonate synthetase-like enzyme